MADEEDHRLIAERKRKVEELRQLGINPYPYKYEPTHHAKELQAVHSRLQPEESSGEHTSIAGRLMLLRRMGKMSFGHVQDQTGRIQVWFKADVLGEKYDLLKHVDLGDFLGIKGEVIKTKTGEVTVLVKEFLILAKSIRPLPEKYHGLKDEEERFRKRYLDLTMNPEVKELFEKRAKITQSVRETLTKRGFLEVETPTLQTIYGGANAKPFITHINAWDIKMYLSISPENYLKRLLVGGYEKIFTICKNFRNEGVDQTHNPEFTMTECYQAYADYNTMMEIIEECYENACKAVHGTTTVVRNGTTIDFKAPWPRITMKDAIKKYGNINVEMLSDAQLHAMVTEHSLKATTHSSRGDIILALFEHFAEKHLIQPTHVIDHPIESTPLCKPIRTGDLAIIERFESFCMGTELCNAYSELNDPVLQRKLLEEQASQLRAGADEAHPMDEDFVQAIEYGMPPAGGLGFGIDRMVIMLLGVEGIRDIIFFPTMKPEAGEKSQVKQTETKPIKKHIPEIEEVPASYDYKERKIIAVLSDELSPGQTMNALGHIAFSAGRYQDQSIMGQPTITDADGNEHTGIAKYPFIVLKASKDEIKKIVHEAKHKGIFTVDYPQEMFDTGVDDQLVAALEKVKEETIVYHAVVLVGNNDDLKSVTGHLKLYK